MSKYGTTITIEDVAAAVAEGAAAVESARYWKAQATEWERKYLDLLDHMVKEAGASTNALFAAIVNGCIVAPKQHPVSSEGETT